MTVAAVSTLDRLTSTSTASEINSRLRCWLGMALVAGLAAFLMFFRLGDTRAPIWDEAYYLTATARYHLGTAQFASHPPLGLMLIAAGDELWGGNADIDLSGMASVKSIKAEQIPAGYDYLGPRLAPAAAGCLAMVLFFLLMRTLTSSTSAGLFASALMLFDPAILVQFRAAQLDAFQVLFLTAALLALVRVVRQPTVPTYFAFGLCVMLAALVRANGILIGIGGAVAILCQVRFVGLSRCAGHAASGALGGLAGLCLVVLAYAAVSLRPPDSQTDAGRKDAAFVSIEHRLALETGVWTVPAYTAAIADQVNFIAADLQGVPKVDANGSAPASWLLGGGAITYRWADKGSERSYIALIPNRIAWCLSLLGVILAVARLRDKVEPLPLALLAIWLVSMATLFTLDGERVLYSYHYFVPLICGYALGAHRWNAAPVPEFMTFLGLASTLAWFALFVPFIFDQRVQSWRCDLALLTDCR